MASDEEMQRFMKDVKTFLEELSEGKLSSGLKKKRKELLEKCDDYIKSDEQGPEDDDIYDDMNDLVEDGKTSNAKGKASDSSSNESGSVRSKELPAAQYSSTSKEPSSSGKEPQIYYDESVTEPVPATDLKTKAMCFGPLKKKAKFGSRQKYYGVHNGLMYCYAKETDSCQKSVIQLKDYDCKECPEESNEKKKEFVFVMSGTGCKTHKFFVNLQDARQQWIAAINRGISQAKEKITNDGELYTDAKEPDEGIDEDLYEDTGDYAQAPPVPIKTELSTRPESRTNTKPDQSDDPGEEYSDTRAEGEDEDFYDDVDRPQRETVEEAAEDEDIYDDTDNLDMPPPPKQQTKLAPPPLPPGREGKSPIVPPLSPTSHPVAVNGTDHTQSAVNGETSSEAVYDRMYYCVYDCQAGSVNEMSFKRGEEVEIIEKRYDTDGWWVGKIATRVGLVPKDFLSPMYKEI